MKIWIWLKYSWNLLMFLSDAGFGPNEVKSFKLLIRHKFPLLMKPLLWASVYGRFVKTSGQATSLLCINYNGWLCICSVPCYPQCVKKTMIYHASEKSLSLIGLIMGVTHLLLLEPFYYIAIICHPKHFYRQFYSLIKSKFIF